NPMPVTTTRLRIRPRSSLLPSAFSLDTPVFRQPVSLCRDWRGERFLAGGAGERLPSDGEERDTGEHAEEPGDPERELIPAGHGANRAGAEGGHRRPELMAGADPPVNHAGVLSPEGLARELYRRRHGRDPVETVEDGEHAES